MGKWFDRNRWKYVEYLNSFTKFPSIPTYHRMKDGVLTEELSVPELSAEERQNVIVGEKVDGANFRVIVNGSGEVYVGTRNEIVWSNMSPIECGGLDIPKVLDRIGLNYRIPTEYSKVAVLYGEVYGGGIQKWRRYTADKDVRWAVFFASAEYDYEALIGEAMNGRSSAIAARRNSWELGVQLRSLDPGAVFAPHFPGAILQTAPLWVDSAPPTGLADAYEWLHDQIAHSLVTLDGDATGQPEGVIIHAPGVKMPVKLRFDDYKRALKRRKG